MRNYRAIQSLCRHSSLRLATLASVLLLSACQPSPEERLAAANQYMATGDYPAAIIEVKNALQADPDNAAARALLAEASYRVADFETATDEYRRALAGDESIDNYLGLGRSLLRSGNAVEAFDSVHEHLPDSSDDERVHVLMGEIYSALGNYANAQAAFQRAVDIEPASVGGLVGMAVVTGAQGDTAQARSLLIKATEADPSAARAWTVLGNFERVAGNLDAATAAYKKAVALDSPALPVSERFEARAALITTAIETRDLELAEGELALLQALLPGHPTLNYLRGQLAFVQGDADTAASEMQKYLSRVPNDARAQAVMGAISYSQNHFSQAEMYLQQARLGNAGESGNRAVNRLLAETRLRLNRPDDALAILSDSNASEIDDPALLGLLGRAEFSAGNRATAMEYFEQGRQAAPDDLAINLMYAVALLTEGRNDDAVEVLESLPPAADDTLHRRSMLLIAAQVRASDLTAARATADELIATNPEDAAAHAVVGSFKRSIGEVDEAEQHFRDALGFEASNELALTGLAGLAMERGDTDAARQAVETLLDAAPANMSALTMLGQILWAEGAVDLYRQRLDAAIAANPQASGPRLLRGRVELATGNADQALSFVRESRELFPDLASFRHLEGLVLLRLGQSESAMISLARAAAAEPETPRYAFDLAVARLQATDYVGAVDAIDNYRRLRPEDPVGLSLEVNARLGQDQFDAASDAITAFAEANGDSAVVTALRGDVALAAGRNDQAVQLFEQSAEASWNRGIALRLASAYMATGSDKASEPLARWLAEHPDDAPIRRSYGQILQTGGDRARAIAEYERVLSENRNDPVALNNLAWEYSLEGRPEALDLAKRAYDLRPDVGSIVDTYGWILYKNGRLDEATQMLREAVRLSPDNGEIRFHLARALADAGERSEASQILANLLESDAAFPSRADAQELAESL